MRRIIRIEGSVLGNPTPEDGKYLLSYDPSGNHGDGSIVTTSDKALAKRFTDAGEALGCWSQISTTHPMRPDGNPNRPLTAYSVELVKVEA